MTQATPSPAHPTECDLLARCLVRPADRTAWNALYAAFASVVRSRIHFGRRAFPDHDVEDLVQVVFLKLATGALDRFEGRSSLKGYLLCLADSVRISENRRRMSVKRGSGRVHSMEEIMENRQGVEPWPPAENSNPEDHYFEGRRIAALRTAVDHLDDPRDRQIVSLYFSDEPKVDREIAEQLGMPLNTVTWRRLRALKELKRRLVSPGEASL